MQISPRWARNLSPEQQQLKKAVPQQVRICLTWSSQRFSNDDGETFYASWVFLPVEYENANRKSTPGLSDLYRNSFGAAKAPHFIFAYTKKIQSVNRPFELPSETNTFSLNTWSRWLCGHNVIYHAKWKQSLTSILLRLQISGLPFYHRQTDKIETKQTNKQKACDHVLLSLKNAGKKIRKERKKTGSTVQAVDTFVLETYFVTEVF